MGPVWLLSTRGRPAQAQAVLDACTRTGMTQRGIVYVDGGGYPKLRAAENWTIIRSGEPGGLQASMQHVFGLFPDASSYGWLADDTYPRTRGWDVKLSAAAGEWHLVCCRDLWLSEDPGERRDLESGVNLSSGLCWGGELVRHVGWWALPGVFQAGIDTAWCDLASRFGLGKYLHDVVVEHRHWLAGRRRKDAVDMREHIGPDVRRKTEWRAGWEFEEAVSRLARGLSLEDTTEVRRAQERAVREEWERSLPLARREAIRVRVAQEFKERSE